MTLHLFHRWSNWERRDETYKWVPYESSNPDILKLIDAMPLQTRVVQWRKCETCGKLQREVRKK